MAKQKILEQIRAEKGRVETHLAQEQHKLERLEDRKKYLGKGEGQKCIHYLCNLGGTHTHRKDRSSLKRRYQLSGVEIDPM